MRSDYRLRIYFLVEAFWIVFVIILFRTIPDRKMAAAAATSGFVFLPLACSILEYVYGKKTRYIFFFGQLQFLVLFALPIAAINFFPNAIGIQDGQIFGFSGVDLHRASQGSYFLMILLTMLEYRLEKRKLQMSGQI